MSFYCECCNYRTLYKTHFEKHLKTNKHEKKKTFELDKQFVCKHCNKHYKHKQSLSKHQSICVPKKTPNDNIEKINELEEKLKKYEINNKLLNEKLSQHMEIIHDFIISFNKLLN
jgi:hypothetical protein